MEDGSDNEISNYVLLLAKNSKITIKIPQNVIFHENCKVKGAVTSAKKNSARQNLLRQKTQRSMTSKINAFIVHERQHIELSRVR